MQLTLFFNLFHRLFHNWYWIINEKYNTLDYMNQHYQFIFWSLLEKKIVLATFFFPQGTGTLPQPQLGARPSVCFMPQLAYPSAWSCFSLSVKGWINSLQLSSKRYAIEILNFKQFKSHACFLVTLEHKGSIFLPLFDSNSRLLLSICGCYELNLIS